MTTLGLTGAGGFLGTHMRSFLLSLRDDVDVRLADRDTFADPARLDAFVGKCDVIVHTAGVNRGEDQVVEAGNVELARDLVAAMHRTARCPDVVYASSIQAGADTPYGRGKAQAAAILTAAATGAGASCADVHLPNLFGEGGRAHYNSVVATFVHQLVRREVPVVQEDRVLPLMHAQAACAVLAEAAHVYEPAAPPPEPVRIGVGELREVLMSQADTYFGHGHIPAIESRFEADLFNTLRFAALPDSVRHTLEVHTDRRGAFFEAVRHDSRGQVSVSSTAPGVARGGHFHYRKVERFVVVSGRARIRLRPLFRAGIMAVDVDGREPVAVDMPTLHTHELVNTGEGELITLLWTDDQFDPQAPDTVPAPVDTVEAG